MTMLMSLLGDQQIEASHSTLLPVFSLIDGVVVSRLINDDMCRSMFVFVSVRTVVHWWCLFAADLH